MGVSPLEKHVFFPSTYLKGQRHKEHGRFMSHAERNQFLAESPIVSLMFCLPCNRILFVQTTVEGPPGFEVNKFLFFSYFFNKKFITHPKV